MSTQRREDLWQRRNCMEVARESGHLWFALIAWFIRAIARVGTAPPPAIDRLQTACFHPSDDEPSPGFPERLATNSLQLGHRTIQLVRQDFRRIPHCSPPTRAAGKGTTGTPATRRSSLPLSPAPSVLERLHPPLPHNPAGQCRWTERYDGKRDLHFQYAA